MELNKSLQENSGSSINLQADKIIFNNISVEEKIESGKDADKDQESRGKSYLRITIDIECDQFGEKEKKWLSLAVAQCCDMSIDNMSIKKIEKGSTKVIIELPEKQAEKILKNKAEFEKIFAIAKILKIEDVTQESKRMLAFNIFDSFLDSCHIGICPALSSYFAYTLVDISMDNYIKNKVYFYSLDSIGKDDADRFCMAETKKSIIFNCCIRPTLNKEVFEQDQRQIEEIYHHSCIKRKAYWSYLSRKYRNQDKDYIQSEYFIEKTKEIYRKITKEQNIEALYELKELLLNNSNIASALDMYRYCFLRQCLNEKCKM